MINYWGVKSEDGRGTGTREEGELFPWSGFLLKVYIKMVGSWELS